MTKFGFKADAKRKHAEEASCESEDLFCVQADDAPVLIWGTGPEGCNFVNRAYLEFLGVGSQVDVRRFDWARYVHPDDREAYVNEYLDCFRRRVPFSAAFRFRRHDGEYRWMKSAGQPRYTPSGEFSGFVGSTQDITDVMVMEAELRKAQDNLESKVEQRTRELRESEEKYRRIVETAREGIWILDKDGVTSFVNPAVPRMLGYAEQEIVGKLPFDFIDDMYREKVRGHLRNRREGADEQYVCKYRRKDGREVWAIITANPIYDDGEYAGAFAMITDITERKLAEDALRDRERQLADGQVLTDTGSWEMDMVTGEVTFSDNLIRIVGLPPGRHSYDEFQALVHPEDRERRDAVVRDSLNGKQYDIEYRLVRPDGDVRQIHAIGSLTRDSQGKPVKLIATIQDITERRRAEEALRESEVKYRDLVENANSIIIRWDLNGSLTFFNEFAEEFFGFPASEVLGKNVMDTIVPATESTGRDLAAMIHDVERHPERYKSNINENIRRNGERVWISWTNKAIRDALGNVVEIQSVGNDITVRRRAEEALRGSEEMFRVLAETAPVAICIMQDGKFLYVNTATEKITGYERGHLLSTDFLDLVHPDFREPVAKLYADWLDGRIRGLYRFEIKILPRDGAERWVDIRVNTVENKGRPGLIMTASNITERKRAEEALRQSEERFRALIQNSSDITRILDREGRIIFDSPSSEKILGYPAGELLGKPALDFVHPDDREKCRNDLDEVYGHTNPGAPTEFRTRKADGDYIDVESIGVNMIGVPGVDGIVINTRPITERKRAEEALRESEEKFRALADTSFSMIAVHRGGNLLYVNDVARNITGYSKDELLKMKYWKLFHVDSQELIKKRASARLNGTLEPTSYETKLLTKDGKTKWINLTAGLFVFEGKPAIMATIFDITASKKAEEALKAEKAQAELYLDLMGHDINNMHQIALGYLELVEGMVPDDDPRKELLEKPAEVLQRSAQLIKNVRKLQKLREGVFQTQDVDVCQVLATVQREFGSVPGKAITLNLNGCERCRVRANELLHDVFANLVSNAIKHTGIKADINIDLDIVTDTSGKYCRISVDDNGPGIPDDFKSVIFNRILKGTTKAKGMGLGLYLVKSLVESYGGRVWVEDRMPGDHTKGARFAVLLPAVDK